MLFNNMEFFNVSDIKKEDNGGYSLYRFPESVRKVTYNIGTRMATSATLVEIRFVTDADVIWLTLESRIGDMPFYVFCGDYKYLSLKLSAGEKKTFVLEPNGNFASKGDELLDTPHYKNRYSHNVWRIVIPDGYPIFHGVDIQNGSFIRPPMPRELPSKKLLIYGSSISHGCWADSYMLGYTNIAGELLGVDVMNKGMSGSCREEAQMADYLAGEDFDVMYLELTTNMSNPNDFTTEEVMKRTEYLVRKICSENPSKKIVTSNAFVLSFGKKDDELTEKESRVKDISQRVCELIDKLKGEYKNLFFFNSSEVYREGYYCCYDFVHPSEFGHIRMAFNFAEVMKKYF
ncbi:MAG: SGNH/GDSL hydrolase family protein [Eubacteriales bacterium]|nr:SGNH/GDSL hydrolase family protein [Eubacteriales bacterium]